MQPTPCPSCLGDEEVNAALSVVQMPCTPHVSGIRGHAPAGALQQPHKNVLAAVRLPPELHLPCWVLLSVLCFAGLLLG